MIVTVKNLSPGPTFVNTEKGVHIMRLVIDTSPAAAGAASPAGDPPVARNIGAPRPTDILVFDHRPWHFAGGGMHPHPQVHTQFPETILQLSVGGEEKAVWWSEEQFTILDISPSHDPNPGPYPFPVRPQTVEAQDIKGGRIFIARSMVPIDTAKRHRYKIKFSIGGEDIDPDMSCNP